MSTTPEIKIAVVEDNRVLGETICDMLVQEGYKPILCGSCQDFTRLLEEVRFDLVLLDLALPDGDGRSLIARIATIAAIPIIVITAKGAEIDRIVGLEMGADDYVVKPFSVRELVARVRALLRRTGFRPNAPVELAPRAGFRFGGWILDTERRRLFDPRGEQITLTVAEYDLLSVFVAAHGRVLSRNKLLELTRRENDDVFDRTIDVLILRLRRKIEPNPQHPTLLRTERGVGYVFEAQVERFGSDHPTG